MHCFHFFAVVVDVVTELARKGMLSELLLHADDLAFKKKIEGLVNKFSKLKAAIESKGLKV